jgi:hypothetical protein
MRLSGILDWARTCAGVVAMVMAGVNDARSEGPATPDTYRAVQLYAVGGGFVPLGVTNTVTGVDATDAPPLSIANAAGGTKATTPPPVLGMRAHVPLFWHMSGEQGPLFGFFFETGIQTSFGVQSAMLAFQDVSDSAAGFGSQTIRENFQVPLLLGASLPLDTNSSGAPGIFLDVYGGVTLDSWTQTLQGAEANAPGGPGFFGQNRRFTPDPTVGVGLRGPVGNLSDDLPLFFGVNAELQFRPGSVVTASSQNFPVIYYGTVNPYANLALMARVGVAFGRR